MCCPGLSPGFLYRDLIRGTGKPVKFIVQLRQIRFLVMAWDNKADLLHIANIRIFFVKKASGYCKIEPRALSLRYKTKARELRTAEFDTHLR